MKRQRFMVDPSSTIKPMHIYVQYNMCKTATLIKTENWFQAVTNYRLMQVRSIAECSKGSILQYFRPSLSYILSLRFLFRLFLSGRFRHV